MAPAACSRSPTRRPQPIEPIIFTWGLGRRLMRVTYLDEAGTANKAHEPYLVVAGVIVDPDRDYAGIDAALRRLGDRCFPDGEGLPEGTAVFGKPLVFHAKDAWHGSGIFPRLTWPLAKRMEVLRELSEIPWKFGLAVVYGAV